MRVLSRVLASSEDKESDFKKSQVVSLLQFVHTGFSLLLARL